MLFLKVWCMTAWPFVIEAFLKILHVLKNKKKCAEREEGWAAQWEYFLQMFHFTVVTLKLFKTSFSRRLITQVCGLRKLLTTPGGITVCREKQKWYMMDKRISSYLYASRVNRRECVCHPVLIVQARRWDNMHWCLYSLLQENPINWKVLALP